MTRVIIYGAGAVGGVVAGRLHEAGADVAIVARGEHLRAVQRDGLVIRSRGRVSVCRVRAVADPADLAITSADIVLLTVKSQDTADVLERLLGGSGDAAPAMVCMQNGVANEREVLRRFTDVYGVNVVLPALHIVPGEVSASGTPIEGLFDVGRYPLGGGGRTSEICEILASGGFDARVVGDIMRWKYKKLLTNLANAVEVVCGPASRSGELAGRARDEGRQCLVAAGIDFVSDDEDADRRAGKLTWQLHPSDGPTGSSMWQSVARGVTSIEVDYLNGEIVLLGRLHGVSTPVNGLLQRLARDVALGRAQQMPEAAVLDVVASQRPCP